MLLLLLLPCLAVRLLTAGSYGKLHHRLPAHHRGQQLEQRSGSARRLQQTRGCCSSGWIYYAKKMRCVRYDIVDIPDEVPETRHVQGAAHLSRDKLLQTLALLLENAIVSCRSQLQQRLERGLHVRHCVLQQPL